jgi:hypothetical protein
MNSKPEFCYKDYYQATLFLDRASGKQETGGWVGPWINLDSLEKSTTPVSTDPLLNQYGTREQQIKGEKQRPNTSKNNPNSRLVPL